MMSWNRVEGFDVGNEPALGATSSQRRQSGDAHQSITLLSEHEKANYSDYYVAKGAAGENGAGPAKVDEELELVDLHDPSLRAYQDATPPSAKKLRVILPNSKFRQVWINIQLFVVLYIVWVTPVRVGFNKPAAGFWFWVEGLIDLFFYTDLVLNFFTAYEHPVTGELITSHRKIATRYLKTWFIIDLLATFPVDYIVRGIEGTWECSVMNNCYSLEPTDSAASLVVMLRMLRVFRILWIFKNFNVLSVTTVLGRLQDEIYMARWVLSILELLIVLAFLGHLSGCFFYFFSGPHWQTPAEARLIADGDLSTWVLDKLGGYYQVVVPTPYTPYPPGTLPDPSDTLMRDPKSGQWYVCPEFYTIFACPECEGAVKMRCRSVFSFAYRYITTVYWAYTTMTTVGYGDIYGTTIAEKVWCMVTMVLGGFFLSFCFGRMASIVGRLDADKVARGEQLHELTAFMKDVELPRPLARKVLEYHKKQKVRSYDRQAVLARLPFELRSKILRHLYLPTITQVPLLKAMAEDDVFLTDLCVRLQPTHFSGDTYVYQRGEAGVDIYILLQGDLHVLDSNAGPLLYKVIEGTVFGESSLVRQLEGADKVKRRESVLAKSPCDMLRLPEADCVDMCEHYPELLRGLKKLDRVRRQRSSRQTQLGVPTESSALSALLMQRPALSSIQMQRPATDAAAALPGDPTPAQNGKAEGGSTGSPRVTFVPGAASHD